MLAYDTWVVIFVDCLIGVLDAGIVDGVWTGEGEILELECTEFTIGTTLAGEGELATELLRFYFIS